MLEQYAYVHFAFRFNDVRGISGLKGWTIMRSWRDRTAAQRQAAVNSVRQDLINEVVARNTMVIMIAMRRLNPVPLPAVQQIAPHAQNGPNAANPPAHGDDEE